jgi:3-isopropylmalate/(R)-2-methylmalate dehydratase small subunit
MATKGRAWVFGDDISTDLINPGPYLYSPVPEAAMHTFEAIEPGYADKVKKGDVIIAGRNFGCGSSRETAVLVLKHLGIECVLAESFARIFFRNAISLGLSAMVCRGLRDRITPLEEVEVSTDSGDVVIARTREVIRGIPLDEKMRTIIQAGGVDGLLANLDKDQA